MGPVGPVGPVTAGAAAVTPPAPAAPVDQLAAYKNRLMEEAGVPFAEDGTEDFSIGQDTNI